MKLSWPFFFLRKAPTELHHHAARGPIFESFVLSELYKNFVHRGEQPGLSFWRDSAGHEVDIHIEIGNRLIPVEAKSAQTVAADSLDGMKYWLDLSGHEGPAALIYARDRSFKRSGVAVYPWFRL